MSFPPLKIRLFAPIFVLSLLSDCTSKRVAVAELTPEHVPHEILGDAFRFTLAYNVKAAMGLSAGPASRWVFALLAIGMLAAVAAWLWRTESTNRLLVSGLALVAGGAAGNLLDRLRWDRGVVDFIDVGVGDLRFYIFNVADAAICVGAVLVWLAMRHDERRIPGAASSAAA